MANMGILTKQLLSPYCVPVHMQEGIEISSKFNNHRKNPYPDLRY